MQLVCDAPIHCEPARYAAPESRVTILVHWIEERLTNEEVQQILVSFRDLGPTERVAVLREAAATDGLASCPLADWMAERASLNGPPSQ